MSTSEPTSLRSENIGFYDSELKVVNQVTKKNCIKFKVLGLI